MKVLALACLTLIGFGTTNAAAQKHAPFYGGHPTAPVVLQKPAYHAPQRPGFGLQIGTPNLQLSIGGSGLGLQAQFGGYCPPKPAPVWIPGQWVCQPQQVWLPGPYVQVWCPPVYQTYYNACGQPQQVLVQPGHYETVQQPGQFVMQPAQVWRPGYWQNGC